MKSRPAPLRRPHPDTTGGAAAAVAAAAALAALLIRTLPYRAHLQSGSGLAIKDPDACYHLRRVDLIGQVFPRLPVFDPTTNHPDGAYLIWPPLYDLLLALL